MRSTKKSSPSGTLGALDRSTGGGLGGLRRLHLVAAALLRAEPDRSLLLGGLLGEERVAALRAGLGDRLVPERELALRIARAGVEELAAARGLRLERAVLALGALHAGVRRRRGGRADLPDPLASGVAGAAVEGAEARATQRHRLAAELAGRD